MIDFKEIVTRAHNAANDDARQKKIATEVLKILSDNGTNVSEAIAILHLVEKMIVSARLDFIKFSHSD